jgi:hypothetical protein
MATTIANVLSCCPDLRGPVKWGVDPQCPEPGVYLVLLPYTVLDAPLDVDVLRHWVANARMMTVGGKVATVETVATVLCSFWHADERILYLGTTGANSKTRSITKRIHEYYGTPIGSGRPHRGGYWIKTLADLSKTLVYWSPSDDPGKAEQDLQEMFIKLRGGSDASALPFANLQRELDKSRKAHGIQNPEF